MKKININFADYYFYVKFRLEEINKLLQNIGHVVFYTVK